ncbi:MAG: HEAT repeat domain-containing protein [Anaerolineae bacterium]|nr:HEAT repeat domain-containing protein [Anaerolineae bacterium]MCA9891583.1 HEAT repeat domain-containing protein [Anaerolineae bacterium]
MTLLTGREPALSNKPRTGWKLSPRRLATMLLNLPPEAISLAAAEEMLKSDDLLIRYHGATLLSKRGDRDARLIMERQLRQGNPATRASVARRLYTFSWFAAEPLLQLAAHDPDPRVREAAIYALCEVGTYNAYQIATESLIEETEDFVFMAVAVALRRRSDADAVPLLEQAMRAQDPEVRVKVLETLGENNTAPTIPIVKNALYDDDPDVLDAAAQSYVEVYGEAALPLVIERILAHEYDHRLALLQGMNQSTNRMFIDLANIDCTDAVFDMLEITGQDRMTAIRRRTVMCLSWIRHARADTILESILASETNEALQADFQHIVSSLRNETI